MTKQQRLMVGFLLLCILVGQGSRMVYRRNSVTYWPASAGVSLAQDESEPETAERDQASEEDEERHRDKKPEAPPTTDANGETVLIDVNTACAEELQLLPGIGPVLAARLIEAREDDLFEVPEDLLRVQGIGPVTLERMLPLIRLISLEDEAVDAEAGHENSGD